MASIFKSRLQQKVRNNVIVPLEPGQDAPQQNVEGSTLNLLLFLVLTKDKQKIIGYFKTRHKTLARPSNHQHDRGAFHSNYIHSRAALTTVAERAQEVTIEAQLIHYVASLQG